MKRRAFITLLGGVAARGAGATADDAGDRVYLRRVGRSQRALYDRVPQRPQRNRHRRRPERDSGVPLAGGPSLPDAETGTSPIDACHDPEEIRAMINGLEPCLETWRMS